MNSTSSILHPLHSYRFSFPIPSPEREEQHSKEVEIKLRKITAELEEMGLRNEVNYFILEDNIKVGHCHQHRLLSIALPVICCGVCWSEGLGIGDHGNIIDMMERRTDPSIRFTYTNLNEALVYIMKWRNRIDEEVQS